MKLLVKILAGLVGAGIIGCVIHASIMASGGYDWASSPMMVALGCGLAIGSICVGVALGDRRFMLGGFLIIALGAGEVYALLQTAERTIAHREKQAAPLREADHKRAKAQRRIDAATAAVEKAKADTPRLTAALAAKTSADAAAVTKAAEKGCRENCRQLLQQQVENASKEIVEARAEIAGNEKEAAAELAAARQALEDLPDPVSASPLADRTGIAAWKIDLTVAALASIAANGLGAALIAFAAHGVAARRRQPEPVAATPVALVEVVDPAPAPEPLPRIVKGQKAARQLPKPERRDADAEADLFARKTIAPDPSGRVYLRDLRKGYHSWCREMDRDPLPDQDIAAALNTLFRRVGLSVDGKGADAAIEGIAWRAEHTAPAAVPSLGPHRVAMGM